MGPETKRVLLCNNPLVYLDQYDDLVKNRAKTELSNLVAGRFQERYLLDMAPAPRGGTGFAIAAMCCLTIEALESFRAGCAPQEMKGKRAFPQFFRRHPIMPQERVFCGFSQERINCSCFYHGVRCGILHSGETTGGWRVRSRDEPIFAEESDRIVLNAPKLQALVRKDLADYVDALREAEWTATHRDERWDKFLTRMAWTVKHCNKTPLGGEQSTKVRRKT